MVIVLCLSFNYLHSSCSLTDKCNFEELLINMPTLLFSFVHLFLSLFPSMASLSLFNIHVKYFVEINAL